MKRYFSYVLVLMLLLGAGAAMAQEEAAAQGDSDWGNPMDWVGKDAAAVKLPLLDGGELDTEALKGDKVVVLDFWATWCPWCVKSTEHVVERYNQYKDKGVDFYMVAVGQGKEPVAKFVEAKELKVPMALDSERKASDTYWVDYIPHVVIIGKDGKVAAVAIGEDKIGAAIDETLERLLSEAPAEAPAE
ncbi:MAG: redoxin domain-containing protein [Candidatus Hydrogenedens sp.]|nr:redoxin domain-containing protein [Candidatus Hydrogenedens sp.]